MAYLKILAVGTLASALYLLVGKALIITFVRLLTKLMPTLPGDLRGHDALPLFLALGALIVIASCYWEYRRVMPNRV
jgi:hypothetical protein